MDNRYTTPRLTHNILKFIHIFLKRIFLWITRVSPVSVRGMTRSYTGRARCAILLRRISGKMRAACKPGSVPGKAGRWPFIWDARRRTPRATYPNDRPEDRIARKGCRSYLVLLPVGFAMPATLPPPRRALAAPFHPCPRARRLRRAVCSLWHFPWGHPRRELPGTVSPWSPDFPPPQPDQPERERPPGHPHEPVSRVFSTMTEPPESGEPPKSRHPGPPTRNRPFRAERFPGPARDGETRANATK